MPEKNIGARNKQDRPAHILLRVRSEGGQTIAGHASVVAKNGTALLGKMGQPVSKDFNNTLNSQIESGINTYLFLAVRDGYHSPYVFYRCLLKKVHNTLDYKKKPLVPDYYAHDIPAIKTWFEITAIQPLTLKEIEAIFITSSGRPAASAVYSRTSIFRVEVKG